MLAGVCLRNGDERKYGTNYTDAAHIYVELNRSSAV